MYPGFSSLLPRGHVVGPLQGRMGLVMLRPLASGSGGRVDTGFPWNIPEPALDLAPPPDLFEAAGGVYPTNQNLGHVACRVI